MSYDLNCNWDEDLQDDLRKCILSNDSLERRKLILNLGWKKKTHQLNKNNTFKNTYKCNYYMENMIFKRGNANSDNQM